MGRNFDCGEVLRRLNTSEVDRFALSYALHIRTRAGGLTRGEVDGNLVGCGGVEGGIKS